VDAQVLLEHPRTVPVVRGMKDMPIPDVQWTSSMSMGVNESGLVSGFMRGKKQEALPFHV